MNKSLPVNTKKKQQREVDRKPDECDWTAGRLVNHCLRDVQQSWLWLFTAAIDWCMDTARLTLYTTRQMLKSFFFFFFLFFFFFFFQSKKYDNFCLVSALLSLVRHYLFTYFFQCSFRVVSEQFQINFRATSEQFQGTFFPIVRVR